MDARPDALNTLPIGPRIKVPPRRHIYEHFAVPDIALGFGPRSMHVKVNHLISFFRSNWRGG